MTVGGEARGKDPVDVASPVHAVAAAPATGDGDGPVRPDAEEAIIWPRAAAVTTACAAPADAATAAAPTTPTVQSAAVRLSSTTAALGGPRAGMAGRLRRVRVFGLAGRLRAGPGDAVEKSGAVGAAVP